MYSRKMAMTASWSSGKRAGRMRIIPGFYRSTVRLQSISPAARHGARPGNVQEASGRLSLFAGRQLLLGQRRIVGRIGRVAQLGNRRLGFRTHRPVQVLSVRQRRRLEPFGVDLVDVARLEQLADAAV